MLGGSKIENLSILAQAVLELCPIVKCVKYAPVILNITNGIGTTLDTVVRNNSASSIVPNLCINSQKSIRNFLFMIHHLES